MRTSDTPQLNPWKSLWLTPRKTLRYLLETSPRRAVLGLSALGGALSGLAWTAAYHLTHPEFPYRPFPIIAIMVAGAVVGILHLYIFGWLYRLIGGWLGGKGTQVDVRCALGWSQYPFAVAAFLSFLAATSNNHVFLQMAFNLLYLIVSVWGLIIFFQTLGEAHQFSGWRALGTVAVTVVLLLVLWILAALIVPLIFPLIKAT